MPVITFSSIFPKHHPRAGQPTRFAHKIRATFALTQLNLTQPMGSVKCTTIRAGERWKKGDRFMPREWSGMPYRSKQTNILEEQLTVLDAIPFERNEDECFAFGHKLYAFQIEHIAKNDGFDSAAELLAWLPQQFKGQILVFFPIIWQDCLYKWQYIEESTEGGCFCKPPEDLICKRK